MAFWHINGGRRLHGACFAQGAKNAALPILTASVISGSKIQIMNVPELSDVSSTLRILRMLGCVAEQDGNNVYIDSNPLHSCVIDKKLMETMRSSMLFMGALLARCGEVHLTKPGGCNLGSRPIDMHLYAMQALGAEIEETKSKIICRAKRLKGADIVFDFPSVGATENAMLAACAAEGKTVIHGAAKEPEITDLQEFLRKMGVFINGAGTDTITVNGFEPERETGHRIIPDRIEACTLLCCAAAAGGEIEIRGVNSDNFSSMLHFLNEAGCDIICGKRSVYLKSDGLLRAVDMVETQPYPGFPTDAQPLLMAAMLKARGKTAFTENIFDNRYRHVDNLRHFGADVSVNGKNCCVWGVKSLKGASVSSTDLRGGAAMIIAALSADGASVIADEGHICRGYENLDYKLRALGADIYMEK